MMNDIIMVRRLKRIKSSYITGTEDGSASPRGTLNKDTKLYFLLSPISKCEYSIIYTYTHTHTVGEISIEHECIERLIFSETNLEFP